MSNSSGCVNGGVCVSRVDCARVKADLRRSAISEAESIQEAACVDDWNNAIVAPSRIAHSEKIVATCSWRKGACVSADLVSGRGQLERG